MSNSSSIISRRLYRSLLKAAKPFSPPSPDAVVLSCLLHRSYKNQRASDDFDNDDDIEYDDDRSDFENYTGLNDAGEFPSSSSPSSSLSHNHRAMYEKLLDDFFSADKDNVDGTRMAAAIGNSNTTKRYLLFPHHVETGKLLGMIRREFRSNEFSSTSSSIIRNSISSSYDLNTRRQVAFMALRELNRKLVWAGELQSSMAGCKSTDDYSGWQSSLSSFSPSSARPIRIPDRQQQAALYVSPLPVQYPESYLKPGVFLISHPLLDGFFHQSVVCILDVFKDTDLTNSIDKTTAAVTGTAGNSEEEDDGEAYDNNEGTSSQRFRGIGAGGVYGLVVNKVSTSAKSGKSLTLSQVLRAVPPELEKSFGNSLVNIGGPVHEALQMLHSSTPEQQENLKSVGGKILSMAQQPLPSDEEVDCAKSNQNGTILNNKNVQSTAFNSDKAVYFQGDILKASEAISKGYMDRDDATLFVGASCWYPGQLQREIEQGCWIPCIAPPEIAHTGVCEHYYNCGNHYNANNNKQTVAKPATSSQQRQNHIKKTAMANDTGKSQSPRPKADLWLSMMSACGEDEAKLAFLLREVDVKYDDGANSNRNKNGNACDDFDDL